MMDAQDPARLPRAALIEAFYSSGEKNFALSRLLYWLLFGSKWDFALMGFSYMKLLDNIVDEDPDVERAAARLADQREWIEKAYSGQDLAGELPSPDRYGWLVFRHDRALGSRQRRHFEEMIETLDFDLRRRHMHSTRVELDDWAKWVGGISIRYLAHFVCPRHPLPDDFVDLASLAYLRADSLIDLEEDLAIGLVNVPLEEIQARQIQLELGDSGLRAWIAEEAAIVGELMAEALRRSSEVRSRAMRILTRLYLSRKDKGLRSFLEEQGIQAGSPPRQAEETMDENLAAGDGAGGS